MDVVLIYNGNYEDKNLNEKITNLRDNLSVLTNSSECCFIAYIIVNKALVLHTFLGKSKFYFIVVVRV